MREAYLVVVMVDGTPGVGTFYNLPDAEAFQRQQKSKGAVLLPVSLAMAAPAIRDALVALVTARTSGAVGTTDPAWKQAHAALDSLPSYSLPPVV